MRVSLVPPRSPPPRAERVARGQTPEPRARGPSVLPAPPPASDASAPTPQHASEGHPPPQGVLRGLRGCDGPDLTREERERCRTDLWARTAPTLTARLDLDPAGRFAGHAEPFLSRRPSNGCRLRATGDTDVMGDSQGVRAGLTCVLPF